MISWGWSRASSESFGPSVNCAAPHPRGVADAERHQHELFVVRHRCPCGQRREGRADHFVRIRRRRCGLHLERHHRGDVFERRDQQPFPQAAGRRFLLDQDQKGVAGRQLQGVALFDHHALLLDGIVGHRLFDFRKRLRRQRDQLDEGAFAVVFEARKRDGGLKPSRRRHADPRRGGKYRLLSHSRHRQQGSKRQSPKNGCSDA